MSKYYTNINFNKIFAKGIYEVNKIPLVIDEDALYFICKYDNIIALEKYIKMKKKITKLHLYAGFFNSITIINYMRIPYDDNFITGAIQSKNYQLISKLPENKVKPLAAKYHIPIFVTQKL